MKCYRCGHVRDAHDHYRANLDCALCGCPWFQAPTWWRRLLYDVAGRQPYTETESVAGGKR